MAGYNRNRSFQFEPGDERPPRNSRLSRNDSAQPEENITFDDDFDDVAPQPAPRSRRPQPRRNPREDEQFDNYRPGTMLGQAEEEERRRKEQAARAAQQPARRRSARVNENYDARFDDDFDDEIIPKRKAAPPTIDNYRPARRGYSRANNFGEDYDEEQFRSEFGGIKGLGVRKRQLSEQEQLEQRRRERREREQMESDGYRGGREMMVDGGYDGSVGVPKLFADYFRDDYEPQKRVIVTGGRTSYVRRRANKAVLGAVAAVMVVALLVGVFVFIGANRVSKPLLVSTALSSMDADTSLMLIKQTVDGTLSTKSIAVTYTGDAGQSGTGLFRLADSGFEYTDNEDGTVEYVEVKDAEGKAVNHTYRTVGSIRFDETAVISFLNELVGEDGEPMREPTHEVKLLLDPETWEYSAELVVTAGADGYGIDYNGFIDKAMEAINTGVYDPIETQLQVTKSPDIDVENIHKQVYKEPVDAFSVTDGLGQTTYTEHVIGMDFSTSELQQIISGSNEDKWTMDLKISVPKLTIQELRKDECPDLLATYYTEFNANNVGRTSNIKKCCEYINNYYAENPMQPGDIFSFNDIVGQRTPERGFSKATVYSSEGTDEDFGGGICQVSSTLYYTTILANLETVHRRNHMYTVSYMWNKDHTQQTFHNDATVNWGTCDYQFKNSKQYPIRIELIVSGATLTCNIWGTWDGFTADIFPQEIGGLERPKTIYHKKKDGKSNQAGQPGRVIDSYRKVYYNGEPYYEKNIFECTSSYLPLMEVKYVDAPPAGKEFDVAY
ncbi:MAG: hypothetical protein E7554_04810 [Ruminococcaceae bacterium]|nr:hypothetical protein [Oscillospiraceae bacterium]